MKYSLRVDILSVGEKGELLQTRGELRGRNGEIK